MKKKLTTEEDYRLRVDRVCMYIREHLDKEIDMRRLAVLSAFSPFHFHRIMRAYLKEPIGAFIIRTRVETAAKLLRYTDLPVADIAYRVGYDTPSSLTKSFCKFFGNQKLSDDDNTGTEGRSEAQPCQSRGTGT